MTLFHPEEDEEEDEDDLLRRTGDLVASSDRLPSGALRVSSRRRARFLSARHHPIRAQSCDAFVSSQMKKCLHANAARPSDDGLTTVQFHPSAQVVMTAGLDQSVSLFQVCRRAGVPGRRVT